MRFKETVIVTQVGVKNNYNEDTSGQVHPHECDTWSVKVYNCSLKMADMNTGLLKFILLAIFLLGCFLLKSENNNFHRSDSDVINPKDKEEHCQPKTRIAFAKTHKTGSSTIQVGLT